MISIKQMAKFVVGLGKNVLNIHNTDNNYSQKGSSN